MYHRGEPSCFWLKDPKDLSGSCCEWRASTLTQKNLPVSVVSHSQRLYICERVFCALVTSLKEAELKKGFCGRLITLQPQNLMFFTFNTLRMCFNWLNWFWLLLIQSRIFLCYSAKGTVPCLTDDSTITVVQCFMTICRKCAFCSAQ